VCYFWFYFDVFKNQHQSGAFVSKQTVEKMQCLYEMLFIVEQRLSAVIFIQKIKIR